MNIYIRNIQAIAYFILSVTPNNTSAPVLRQRLRFSIQDVKTWWDYNLATTTA